MKKDEMNPLFKKGVWIKEQHGDLTIGALGGNDKSGMVIPEKLKATILEFENDMVDAIYGEDKVAFNPEKMDIGKLLENLRMKFSGNDLRISFSGEKGSVFQCEYDKIFSLLEKFVLSSLSVSTKIEDLPRVYINTSLVQDHLCIIYRDSESVSDPANLKNEIALIKTDLKGEINYKTTDGEKSYYDIMIPSQG